ncbi:MAG: response regulator transcription factor [Planctomycetia bacterium]|nr:response regulator transcription factor [Planctomycetia bacterium]
MNTILHSPSPFPVRLAVVDDETLVREGLVALFHTSPDFRLVASASESELLLEALPAADRPDVALLDVRTTGTGTLAGVRLWQERFPEIRIVLLDDAVRDAHLRQAVRLQVHGYALKQDSFYDLTQVIEAAARDVRSFSPSAGSRLISTEQGWDLQPSNTPGLHSLTMRETEVLTCLAQGFTVKVCSALLHISPSTVDNHKSRIMKKLKMHKTVDLARLALREGLMPR